jgi:hypothetical protein
MFWIKIYLLKLGYNEIEQYNFFSIATSTTKFYDIKVWDFI